jgi:mediator of RNA polymerase II transcription subunit 14
MSIETPKYGMSNRKHCLSDIVHSIPSLQRIAAHGESQKKRKTVCESGNPQRISAKWDVFMEANHGKDTSKIYTSVLLQVVRQCFLRIKHDCLTSQMAALGIQYIEDMSFQNPSAYVWFRLPLCRNNAWENMGLLLVNPGSTYWDVKVNDDHFRDLWELHNGKTGTPWGSGVRIANTSDVDSHIQYGPEGVVLSYRTVEENSIQKLVADLQRLSNARSFAMGMRRLLGVKPDEKIDTGKENCNMKTQNPMKIGAGEGRDRMWRLIGKRFRIEAVGLMSIWFSYFESMPGSIARFVVEWETGKEGCTMHVFPNHLWPHTKVISLSYCFCCKVQFPY